MKPAVSVTDTRNKSLLPSISVLFFFVVSGVFPSSAFFQCDPRENKLSILKRADVKSTDDMTNVVGVCACDLKASLEAMCGCFSPFCNHGSVGKRVGFLSRKGKP